jgi:hypothetical protein
LRRALLAVLLALAACDSRACLAQSPLFEGYREELVEECCNCLARAGTEFPGAACGEAFIDVEDGGVTFDPDAGPSNPEDEPFFGDENDLNRQPGEVPCICDETINSKVCASLLLSGAPILVTGACISQGAGAVDEAVCEAECKGVLTFDPLSTAQQ